MYTFAILQKVGNSRELSALNRKNIWELLQNYLNKGILLIQTLNDFINLQLKLTQNFKQEFG